MSIYLAARYSDAVPLKNKKSAMMIDALLQNCFRPYFPEIERCRMTSQGHQMTQRFKQLSFSN